MLRRSTGSRGFGRVHRWGGTMQGTAPFETIGKGIPRVEGPDKVTGRAKYPADISLPGTLWATNVRSPYPHARIVSIDPAPALAIPGVRAVLTARDILNRRSGRVLKDMPL